MTKKPNAPRWLDLCDEVANSLGRLNSGKADIQTVNVLNNVIRTLMNKQALPDRLAATFLECIRRRTGRTDFAYAGPIKLTANQIKYAKRHGRDQIIMAPQSQAISPTFQPNSDRDELLAAFQRHFIHISSVFQPDFNRLSSILGPRAAELLEFWWRNEMKSNEINHEPMTCPSDGMKLAGSPDVHDLPIQSHEPAALSGHAMIAHEPAAARFSQAKTIMENHSGGEEMRGVSAPVVQMPVRKTRRPEIAISYFHNDPAKAPSAVFEIGDEKYSLLFATADHAEAKLNGVSAPEWMKWFEAEGGDDIRDASRAAAAAGKLSRYVMSPLYAAIDKYGYKAPVEPDCVVVLGWEDDVPVTALLVAGKNFHPIALEYFSNGDGKKPLFKGRALMPHMQEAPALAA